MTIAISHNAFWEVLLEVEHTRRLYDPEDAFDLIWQYPTRLGEGNWREIQLREGLYLTIRNYQLHDDLMMKVSDREHDLEYNFCISGSGEVRNVREDSPLTIAPGQYFFSGSGAAPSEIGEVSAMQRILSVDVHMAPQLFRSFTGNQLGESSELEHLVRKPTQEYYTRTGVTTSTMQAVLQQILHCPYLGLSKRMYLEGKVLELMALVVKQEIEIRQGKQETIPLKPQDTDRVYYAKEILLQKLDNPPSLMELARLVGLNDCTLKRGFRYCFGTTVFSYLSNYRLEQARQLLDAGEMNITEVARKVGYSDRSPFAAAFRKQFGMNPKEYQQQRNSV